MKIDRRAEEEWAEMNIGTGFCVGLYTANYSALYSEVYVQAGHRPVLAMATLHLLCYKAHIWGGHLLVMSSPCLISDTCHFATV